MLYFGPLTCAWCIATSIDRTSGVWEVLTDVNAEFGVNAHVSHVL